jgi:glutathionyl-hydroquinone reductase
VRAAPVRDWPADLRAEIEQSWEHIFDRSNYGRYEVWQATVHALHAEDVVEAVRIAK